VVDIVKRHLQVHKAVPDPKIYKSVLEDEIKAKRLRDDTRKDVVQFLKDSLRADLSNSKYVLDKVRDFARHRAMENAIMASVQLLEKGDFAGIDKTMKQALGVGNSITKQAYDYFDEVDNRTQEREDLKSGKIVKRGITTGYREIDTCLYHMGWGRQELSVLMGAAKAGKSMGLGDFTKNAVLAGYNAFYASCEVSHKIISARTDANIADVAVNNLHHDPKLVGQLIKDAQRKTGAKYKMQDFASGTLKVSHLYRIIEDYRADGLIFDLITVDYADIMAAEYRNDKLIDNLREIYIDLRAMAHEFDAALLTATQTNRDGAKAVTAKATDVGDDWNKVRTADVLIGINATDSEKQQGKARLYWAVSRNTEDGFTLEIQQDRSKMKFLTKVLGRI
jgi:replicative DNA helicase